MAGIRLRGHRITEHAARTSLKRRKLAAPDRAPTSPQPATPSDISIDDEGEEDDFHQALYMDDAACRRLIGNAAARQRPTSPSLIGDAAMEVLFLQKMRHWQMATSPANADQDYGFWNYLVDLINVLPNASLNTRALWTISRIEPTTRQAFRVHGPWLLAHLSFLAAWLASWLAKKPAGSRFARYIHSTIVRVALETTTSERHPLVVLCHVLSSSRGRPSESTMLRHCSKLSQEIFTSSSWERRTVDDARALYAHQMGELRDAESILASLVDTFTRAPPDLQEFGQVYRCQLAGIHIRRGSFLQAETILNEVLEYCRQISREQGLPVSKSPRPLPDVYHDALDNMKCLAMKKGDAGAAEFWARERLLHCEQAFGTSDARTARAVYGLVRRLEVQGKWRDLEALWEEWKGLIEPPGFFRVEQKDLERMGTCEEVDANPVEP